MKIVNFRKVKKLSTIIGMLTLSLTLFTGCSDKKYDITDFYAVDQNVYGITEDVKHDPNYILAKLESKNKHICEKDGCSIDLLQDYLGLGSYKSVYLKLIDANDEDKFICYSYHYFKKDKYVITYVYNSDGDNATYVTTASVDIPYPDGLSLALTVSSEEMNSKYTFEEINSIFESYVGASDSEKEK